MHCIMYMVNHSKITIVGRVIKRIYLVKLLQIPDVLVNDELPG